MEHNAAIARRQASLQAPPEQLQLSSPARYASAPRSYTVRGLYLFPGDGHWIKSKSDNGAIVVLEDNSVWQIDLYNRVETMLWLPMTEITVAETGDGYLLIDSEDGETAHAILLH